ncbi:hypothetical protein JJL45_13740 [Tamlana sp. s12]|uniref:hypothetical protein n=1 Tax=Flavobacteriaceae TaxID=49546 RepID=UPI0007FC4EE2|nr:MULTISPECIES: hypothetical protein [Tamlana]OBQ56405.1 hypothetical protein VQ01_03370 [Tamlana sp. s12]QQY81972.1 hypothetical protein JJL45_13740 [Tamlana sp. s12]
MNHKKRYKIILVTMWVIYLAYEAYLYFVWAPKEVGAIIRVDLFILWPVLFFVSIYLLYKIFKK